MQDKRLMELLAKRLANELSGEELKELNLLTGEDHANAYQKTLTDKVWGLEFNGGGQTEASYKNERWESLQQQLSDAHGAEKKSIIPLRPVLFRYGAVAACIIAALFICTVFFFKNDLPKSIVKPNIFSTRNGSRSKVQMPDGSQVWLNVGSQLVYDPASFGKPLREVQLTGEAFFDVFKDKDHPFVIHTQAITIRVLGTVFNVKAYPGDKCTEASLLRGSIEVSFQNRPNQKLILKPNEKISVLNTLQDTAISLPLKSNNSRTDESTISLSTINYLQKDSLIMETAWVKNSLVFRNLSFGEVATQMERWYNVKIDFADSALSNRKLTGTFQNESITDALNYLRLTVGFNYRMDKNTNTIFLSKK